MAATITHPFVSAKVDGADTSLVQPSNWNAGHTLTGTIDVANGGTGRATGTTAYALIATGTTATGAQQTLANGATTEILVGGGAAALPVWTTATGSGAPVRANTPTLTTPVLTNPSFSGTTANMGTVTTIDINGGTIDGTVIGGAASAAGTFTALASTGNTTLGDATTDSVTVNGYVGIGGAPSTQIGLRLISAALTGTSQYGMASVITGTSSATTQIIAYDSYPQVADAVFTVTNVRGFHARSGAKGASATATNWHGVYIDDQNQGTNNFGITSLVSSGANKWFIFSSGTANSAFAGNTRFGATTAPTSTVDVTGSVAATTTILSSGATSGIGYTTGAGGTVTQLTSKATGVTLNRCTGLITTTADALAANTTTQFTLTNSAIAATDTVSAHRQSGGTAVAYEIDVDSVAAGSCVISIRNRTAGSLSEAIVIRFSITKGVSA